MKKCIRLVIGSLLASMISFTGVIAEEAELPLIDTHIHYSHDAWSVLSPDQAIQILRDAGLKKAFVSSSSDAGTQKLYAVAPDLVVPVLRPYRKRGELGTWFKDESVVTMLSDLLDKNTYAGIGEFHISGKNADLPVMRSVVQLAEKHQIFLHAHSDADAIDRLFAQNPNARILWAHSGFEELDVISQMLAKHANLWADLSFRSELATMDTVDEDWQKIFEAFPNRFTVGADTYTPERWHYVVEHADWSRSWLSTLPQDLRQKIAYKNAETLTAWALGKK